jgi:Reverse transcriptase (RNA-dependent DNA polymerase)
MVIGPEMVICLHQACKGGSDYNPQKSGWLYSWKKYYDKIAHDYLWKVLETFGIPMEFIKTVKSLYQEAETRIMINGELSMSYKVTWGVRQGDTMSCLLFDLAVESLAALLRNSQLKGYEIPGSEEKLIANLFADDTTTFLSKDNNLEDLEIILNRWCRASTTKSNIQKTEIIPIGNENF